MSDRSASRSPSGSRRRSDSDRSRASSRSRSRSRSSEEREKKTSTTQKIKKVINKQIRGEPRSGGSLESRPTGPAGIGSVNSRSNFTPGALRDGPASITRRVLSAGRLKHNELRNKVAELSGELSRLEADNKLLRRQQYRTEKQLDQYENAERDLPTSLRRQTDEGNVMREQMRRMKEKGAARDKKLRQTEDELERSKKLLKKMKALVDDKKLGEREQLSDKLDKVNTQLDQKDSAIKNLERHIENLTKNHKHEFGIEHARQRDTAQQVEQLKAEVERLQAQLREKEKELGMKNIYHKRAQTMRPPHHLSDSLGSTPPMSGGMSGGASRVAVRNNAPRPNDDTGGKYEMTSKSYNFNNNNRPMTQTTVIPDKPKNKTETITQKAIMLRNDIIGVPKTEKGVGKPKSTMKDFKPKNVNKDVEPKNQVISRKLKNEDAGGFNPQNVGKQIKKKADGVINQSSKIKEEKRRLEEMHRKNLEQERIRQQQLQQQKEDEAAAAAAAAEEEQESMRQEEEQQRQEMENAARQEREDIARKAAQAKQEAEEDARREAEESARQSAADAEQAAKDAAEQKAAAAEEAARYAASDEGREAQRQKDALLAKMRVLDDARNANDDDDYGGVYGGPMASQAPPPRSLKPAVAEPAFGGYQPSFMTSKPPPSTAKSSVVGDILSNGAAGDGAVKKVAGIAKASSPGMTDFLFGDGAGGTKNGGLAKTVRQPLAAMNLAPGQVIDDEDFN